MRTYGQDLSAANHSPSPRQRISIMPVPGSSLDALLLLRLHVPCRLKTRLNPLLFASHPLYSSPIYINAFQTSHTVLGPARIQARNWGFEEYAVRRHTRLLKAIISQCPLRVVDTGQEEPAEWSFPLPRTYLAKRGIGSQCIRNHRE